jgi:hypothetical protein
MAAVHPSGAGSSPETDAEPAPMGELAAV